MPPATSGEQILGPVSVADIVPTGGTDLSALAGVANDTIGKDSELDTSEDGIGIESIAKVVGARLRHELYPTDGKSLAVFLVTDRARQIADQFGLVREPIVDNGGLELSGKLWIGAPTFRSAYPKVFSATDHAGIFAEIDALGLSSHPVLVFDPNAVDLELRYYSNGLSDVENVQTFLIAAAGFTIELLDRVLNRFYETSLKTPDTVLGREGPWSDAAKFIPRPDTEAFLQNWLKISLSSFFQEPYMVYFEVRGTEGRCDLMLVSKHQTAPNTWIHNAVLELKVLRSRTSGGSAVAEPARKQALSGGLLQAIAYRSQFSASHAMLCNFDMRNDKHFDGDACMDHIREAASKASVELRSYRLFPSSKDLRSDIYGVNA
jgi:hypothetical protein